MFAVPVVSALPACEPMAVLKLPVPDPRAESPKATRYWPPVVVVAAEVPNTVLWVFVVAPPFPTFKPLIDAFPPMVAVPVVVRADTATPEAPTVSTPVPLITRLMFPALFRFTEVPDRDKL